MNEFLALAFWGVPLLAAALVSRVRTPRAGRSLAIFFTALAFLASIALLAFNTTAALLDAGTLGSFAKFVATDGLTAALLPIGTGIPLAILVSFPRAELDLRATTNVLVIGATTLGGVLANDLVTFAAFWMLSVAPLGLEARRVGSRALSRAFWTLFVTGVVPLVGATAASCWVGWKAGVEWPFGASSIATAGGLGEREPWIAGAFLVALVARFGVFPLHLWVPVVAARARPSVAIPTIVSPLAAVAMVRIVLVIAPNALADAAPFVLPLAALSSVYGAMLALGQHDASRQLAFVWVSLMGTVLAGFASASERGVTGALLHHLAVVLSVTGLWLHLVAIAARGGTLDLRCLGGIVRTAPSLATGHFLLGLATVAFPGTATFLSEDLIVHGLLESHPVTAGFLLVATALNGLSLVRTFKRIFLGPPSVHAADLSRIEDVQPRERWTSVALVLALLAGGLAPTPLLLLRAGLRVGPRPPPAVEGEGTNTSGENELRDTIGPAVGG